MPVLPGQPASIEDGLSPVDRILSRLDHVKPSGDQWSASCPVTAAHSHGDRNPSLSVKEGDDGRALLCCHKGCSFTDIMTAIDLPLTAAFPTPTMVTYTATPKVTANGHKRIAETYPYYDEQGELLFETVRFEPKDFRQRRPDGKGNWLWNLEGVRRILYRLPELINAPEDQIVYVCEGEKDVDALRALGLVATCNPLGAGKWHHEFCEYLRNRYVAVIEDNDDAGREHAQEVSEALTGTANLVKLVRLPNLPDHGDASDWLAAGGTPTQLEMLTASAPEWQVSGEDRFPIHWAREALVEPEPVQWVVDGLISRGSLSAFVGDAGTKKTWLMLSLAVCIAKGIPWLGHDTMQGTVLLIDEESGHRRLHDRIHRLMRGYDCLEDLPLAWITMTNFDLRNPSDVTKMARKIEIVRPIFVIVDALMEVLAGADENSTTEVLPAIKTFRQVGQDYDFASSILHHANKQGNYRGSSSIKGVVDQMLMVTSKKGDPIVSIASEKMRDCDDVEFGAEAHFEDFPQRKVWFTEAGFVENTKRLSNSSLAVAEYVAQHFSFTTKDLALYAEERGICSPDAARIALGNAVRAGKVKRVNAGGRGSEARYERV